MSFDARTVTLVQYPAPEFKIECIRCRRGAVVERHAMQMRHGNIPLIDVARKIAAAKGCNLAGIIGGPQCDVQVYEVEFWTWARLRDAVADGWRARLYCRRRLAALKRTESCPGAYELDLDTLVMALGDSYPIHKLHSKARCPRCHTEATSIEWYRPDPPKTPAPIAEAPVLRMRPTRAAVARTKLGVAKG